MDRLGKLDPIETLSSPTAVVLHLADIQGEADGMPWMVYYAEQWNRKNPGGWASLALDVAYTHRGDSLMDACDRKQHPLWDQGKNLFQDATNFARRQNDKVKGWPYLDFRQRMSEDRLAIVHAIQAHPQEVGLYQALANIWWGRNREQRLEILKELKAIGPSSYALLFTFHLPVASKGKVNSEGWEWPVSATLMPPAPTTFPILMWSVNKAGRASPVALRECIDWAQVRKLPKDAHRLIPYLSKDMEAPSGQSRLVFRAMRNWALGQAPAPGIPNRVKRL